MDSPGMQLQIEVNRDKCKLVYPMFPPLEDILGKEMHPLEVCMYLCLFVSRGRSGIEIERLGLVWSGLGGGKGEGFVLD